MNTNPTPASSTEFDRNERFFIAQMKEGGVPVTPDQRIRFIVLNGHTLAHVHPACPGKYMPCAASVILGASSYAHWEFGSFIHLPVNPAHYRPAVLKDFEVFRYDLNPYRTNHRYELPSE